MREVYRWIRSLTGFFLFQEILCQLLPGEQYRKYVRLFIGMVLLLVIWQPLTEKSGIESQIAGYYERLLRRYDWQELTAESAGMGEDYQKRMIAAYEEEVGANVMRMAEALGYRTCGCQVTIGTEEGKKRYGMVETIRLELAAEPATDSPSGTLWPAQADAEEAARTASGQVKPVMVEPVEIGNTNGTAGRDEGQTKRMAEREEASSQETGSGESRSSYPDPVLLQEKLAAFYDLEEEHVEIQITQRER